jgi:hypothetical protein
MGCEAVARWVIHIMHSISLPLSRALTPSTTAMLNLLSKKSGKTYTILRWWKQMGSRVYPRGRSLLIVADSGGSNGSRVRLWKWELQRFCDTTGLSVHVCHLPPGTSKWNKIEHRLFSFISRNWGGQPLLTHATIVKMISNTRTSTGLKVRCILDRRRYPTKVVISDDKFATIRLQPDSFHGDWNYTIRPHRQ